MQGLQNPSFSNWLLGSQDLSLKCRVTKTVLNLIVVAVGVPFVVRKESTSLLTNLAMCSGVLGAMMGINEGSLYLGKANVISPEFACWSPLLLWGTPAPWVPRFVRT